MMTTDQQDTWMALKS